MMYPCIAKPPGLCHHERYCSHSPDSRAHSDGLVETIRNGPCSDGGDMNKSGGLTRMEVAGSLGDLGTLLPISLGMVVTNGLDPTGVFFGIGLFYIISGLYFRVTVPVQPMKVIGAYAIATGMSAGQIAASGLLMGIMLLIIGFSGSITLAGRYITRPIIRGVQLSTGTLLMAQGIRFITGGSTWQQAVGLAEPWLAFQHVGPIPIGILMGLAGSLVTFYFLDSKTLPAGLLITLGGLVLGGILGLENSGETWTLGLHLPGFLPTGLPSLSDLSVALVVLVLPQIPMTLGNAVIAYADLSRDYFGNFSGKVTNKSACISMGIANLVSFFIGGMPMCHGAGGLAAHYRFGARTHISNLVIGAAFVILTLLLGPGITELLHRIPMAILGVLLVFAGGQLSLTLLDLKERKSLFTAMIILSITMASNLAAGFIIGILVDRILSSDRMKI